MKINDMFRSENNILIAYCMKAMRPPTSRFPASILWLPIHISAMAVKLTVNIIRGITVAIMRLTRRWVSVRSLFAASNLSASCSSRLKALMTLMPVRLPKYQAKPVDFLLDGFETACL